MVKTSVQRVGSNTIRMLSYRVLPPDEWIKLEPLFQEHERPLPHPLLARIVVAENGSEIVGFLVKMLVAHLEPLWIAPLYRGKASWKRMATMLDMSDTFVFADSPARERMCALAGMTKIPAFTVWHKG